MIRTVPTGPAERAAAVASDYEALQGLIVVGTGAGLLLMAVSGTPALGAVLMGLAVVFGQAYYYKRYGRVRYRSGSVATMVLAAVAVVLLGAAGIIADGFVQWPILLGPLTAAAGLLVFFGTGYRHVGATRPHLVTVAALALCALLPLIGWFAEITRWRLDVAVVGVAFIVIGVLDHLRLTRAMRPAVDD